MRLEQEDLNAIGEIVVSRLFQEGRSEVYQFERLAENF